MVYGLPRLLRSLAMTKGARGSEFFYFLFCIDGDFFFFFVFVLGLPPFVRGDVAKQQGG